MYQSALSQSIIQRAIGVIKLEHPVFEDIEHDPAALVQAAVVVAVVGLANGIGSIRDGVLSVIVSPVGALVGWVIASALIYYVGTRLIPSPQTEADMGQVLRLWGFAAAPGIIAVVGFLPLIGWIFGVAAAIWTVVVGVFAIMHALEMSVMRAVVTAIMAWLITVAVMMVLGFVFGVGSLVFA